MIINVSFNGSPVVKIEEVKGEFSEEEDIVEDEGVIEDDDIIKEEPELDLEPME